HLFVFSFFFFFQAEDGIRDFHVTGVQTCALPILLAAAVSELAEEHEGDKGVVHAHSYMIATYLAKHIEPSQRWRVVTHHDAAGRSEERRVGKECRSRGRPQQ